jgi:hypothetical protein
LSLDSNNDIIFHFNSNSILPFTELEYLEIGRCIVLQLLELLEYVGSNIKRMKIRLAYERVLSINSAIIDEWLSNHQTSGNYVIEIFLLNILFLIVFLNRIEIQFCFLSLTNFHLILRLFPYLKYLSFSTLALEDDFISPSIWYEFISTNLLELKRLQFYIKIKGEFETKKKIDKRNFFV